MEKITQLIARLFLGHIFLIAGLTKISAYAGTQGYMEAMGVPGALLPLVILLEIAGGLAIVTGWKARYSAIILALFSIIAAGIFHNNFDDPMQTILFMKNIAIAGGLMLLAVHGAGACSVDNRLARNTMTINKL